jgi:hypothetical protein
MFQTIKRHWLVSALTVVVGLPVIIFVLWTTIALHYTYSSGERAGLLQKLSKRGWMCKTWEGELQLAALPGIVPEKFEFSVRSDSVAGVLNSLAGKQIVVTYQQHKGVPGSCFGDTEYFVTAARGSGSP